MLIFFNVDFYNNIIIPMIYLLHFFKSIIHVAVQFPHEGLKRFFLKELHTKHTKLV